MSKTMLKSTQWNVNCEEKDFSNEKLKIKNTCIFVDNSIIYSKNVLAIKLLKIL